MSPRSTLGYNGLAENGGETVLNRERPTVVGPRFLNCAPGAIGEGTRFSIDPRVKYWLSFRENGGRSFRRILSHLTRKYHLRTNTTTNATTVYRCMKCWIEHRYCGKCKLFTTSPIHIRTNRIDCWNPVRGDRLTVESPVTVIAE